ncbi:phosphotransferase enzyme family protein [Bordetella sp. FB-8]|uniref:phosphotransferase enzyme family protein n=1 Tax=Bordetella sp. FB-8 TaxID=1159870 RepID=UPI0003826E92|nr:phosphotransferase [Bordetella sp. FB-8]
MSADSRQPLVDGAPAAGEADAVLRKTSGRQYFRDAAAALAAKPDAVQEGVLAELLGRHYGLHGAIKALSSEIEHTASVVLADGRQLIFKTSSHPGALESFGFQACVLAALVGAQGFGAPHVQRTTSGALLFKQGHCCGYLQTRVGGSSLHETAPAPDVLFRAGQALARLDLALASLDAVPSMLRPVLWQVGCWPALVEFERYLPPGGIADAVRLALKNYEEVIEPQLRDVAWQLVHNDPSPFNTFVDKTGVAFIDFGDGCWGPRIQDLAIAASHFVRDPERELGGAQDLIAGYASVLPLSRIEARLLVGLMKARQSALILINYWRAHLFPADAAYIKKSVARAERGLAILNSLSEQAQQAAVRAAISVERR